MSKTEAVNQDAPNEPNYIADNRTLLEASLPGHPEDLLDLYVLIAVCRGTDTTLEDVHDGWSVHTNKECPDHDNLVPYSMLESGSEEHYYPALDAIHAAARGEVVLKNTE